MISHKHRCIFIHIPRCAGTSIETWIVGQDWWFIDPSTKHLLASQAKALYADFWDSYFKFAVVRHPIARVASCLKYADHFGLQACREGISFDGYHTLFGADVVVEHDHRFYKRADLLSLGHQRNCVYGNILDEEIDFVARMETLEQDLELVGKEINKDEPLTCRIERYAQKPEISRADRKHIEGMYASDMLRYSY
jgi:hypothetical protein